MADINGPLKYQMKLHILEVLYCEFFNNSISSAIELAIKIIVSHDSTLTKHFGKRIKLLSKFVNGLINLYAFTKTSSDLGETFMNYMKIDSEVLKPVNTLSYSFLYCIVKFFVCPLLFEGLKDFKFEYYAKLLSFIANSAMKLSYCFYDKQIYFDFVNLIFKVFTVNKGSNPKSDSLLYSGKYIAMIFFSFIMKLGQWYYSKDTEKQNYTKVQAPSTNSSFKSTKDKSKYMLIPGDGQQCNQIRCCSKLKDALQKCSEQLVVCRFCGLPICDSCLIKLILSMKPDTEATPCCNIEFSGIRLIATKGVQASNSNSDQCYIRVYDK